MKDAFGHEIKVDDRVLYARSTGAGTTYVIGFVVELCPGKVIDKIKIRPVDSSGTKPQTIVSVYDNNVVKLPKETSSARGV